VWDSLVCPVRKDGGYVDSIRTSKNHSCFRTGSEEQLSGTSLEIFADFRHAVIYAGILASLAFRVGAFDVGGTTAWWQSGTG
jgi:hypothetical protein